MANNFSLDPTCKALWKFESGALLVDSVGTNTLTDHGTVGSGTAIQGVPSVNLNGSSKYFSVADADLAAGFPFKNGDTGKLITVACKVRLNTTGESPWVGKLAFGAANSFGLTNSGSPFFEVDGSYNNGLGISPGFINGHEYQIIYTIDGPNKLYTLFIFDYTAITLFTQSYTSSSAWVGSTLEWLIGHDANRNYAYGDMGEVVVFNRILNVPEMVDITVGNYSGPKIDFAPHDLTSYTSHSPFVVSDSGTYDPYSSWRVFDGVYNFDQTSLGNTGAAFWIKLDIGSGNTKILQGYGIQVSNVSDWLNMSPKDWTMEGSNDSSTWDTLDTVANETAWSIAELRNYICDVQTTAYRYFRLNISANNGNGSHTQVAELWLLEHTSTSNTYNLITTCNIVSTVTTPLLKIVRPLISSPAVASAASTPLLKITRDLTSTMPIQSAVSAPLLAILRKLIATAAMLSDTGVSNLLVKRDLASTVAVLSAVTTPNLLVQRNLAALAVVLSETSDITLLTSAIYNLVTAIAAQTQTSVTVLKVQRDLVTAMPGQTQTSTASLTRLMRLVNTLAAVTETSNPSLTVLRALATAIAAQTQTWIPLTYGSGHTYGDGSTYGELLEASLLVKRDLTATLAMASETSNPLLTVLRLLTASLPIVSLTPDIGMGTGTIWDLVSTMAIQTQTPEISLKVLRDLVSALAGESATSEITMQFVRDLRTAMAAVTATSNPLLAILRDLLTAIAIESQTSEVGFMWAGYIPEHLRVRALLSQLQAELSAPALRAELALRQLKGE